LLLSDPDRVRTPVSVEAPPRLERVMREPTERGIFVIKVTEIVFGFRG
jgi:hypothetical protein